jgi:hypothetical protein
VSRIYSTRFFSVQGAAGGHSTTVPPGQIAIVRDIDVFWVLGFSTNSIQVFDETGTTFWFANLGAGALTSEVAQWRGRQVIHAGNAWGFTTSGALDVMISGYLLDLP